MKEYGLSYDKQVKGWYSRKASTRRTTRQELWLAGEHPKYLGSITNLKYLPPNAAATLYRDKVLAWIKALPEKAATEIRKMHGILVTD